MCSSIATPGPLGPVLDRFPDSCEFTPVNRSYRVPYRRIRGTHRLVYRLAIDLPQLIGVSGTRTHLQTSLAH